MQEKGTLKIEDFVVYKLTLCEHPVALLELRWLTFADVVSLYFFQSNKGDLAVNCCGVHTTGLSQNDYHVPPAR